MLDLRSAKLLAALLLSSWLSIDAYALDVRIVLSPSAQLRLNPTEPTCDFIDENDKTIASKLEKRANGEWTCSDGLQSGDVDARPLVSATAISLKPVPNSPDEYGFAPVRFFVPRFAGESNPGLIKVYLVDAQLTGETLDAIPLTPVNTIAYADLLQFWAQTYSLTSKILNVAPTGFNKRYAEVLARHLMATNRLATGFDRFNLEFDDSETRSKAIQWLRSAVESKPGEMEGVKIGGVKGIKDLVAKAELSPLTRLAMLGGKVFNFREDNPCDPVRSPLIRRYVAYIARTLTLDQMEAFEPEFLAVNKIPFSHLGTQLTLCSQSTANNPAQVKAEEVKLLRNVGLPAGVAGAPDPLKVLKIFK